MSNGKIILEDSAVEFLQEEIGGGSETPHLYEYSIEYYQQVDFGQSRVYGKYLSTNDSLTVADLKTAEFKAQVNGIISMDATTKRDLGLPLFMFYDTENSLFKINCGEVGFADNGEAYEIDPGYNDFEITSENEENITLTLIRQVF